MNGDSFLRFGENAGYLAELYQLYLSDPSLVDPTWAEFFRSIDQNGSNGLTNGHTNGNGHAHAHPAEARSASGNVVGEKLVQAYRAYGHAAAHVSPLVAGGMRSEAPVELNLSYYGESREAAQVALSSFVFGGRSYSSCAQLEQALKDTAAFFRSEAGKAYVAMQPRVIDQMMISLEAWNRQMSEDLMTRVREEMRKRGHSL
jgi:2-oxoglutarate dehydrogenase complex dehydrogenase (E1) component-like enzyme